VSIMAISTRWSPSASDTAGPFSINRGPAFELEAELAKKNQSSLPSHRQRFPPCPSV
jgi:hypothetical protein